MKRSGSGWWPTPTSPKEIAHLLRDLGPHGFRERRLRWSGFGITATNQPLRRQRNRDGLAGRKFSTGIVYKYFFGRPLDCR